MASSRVEPPAQPVSEWDKLEPVIKRLYFEQDKSLSEVMSFMETNYGLRAT